MIEIRQSVFSKEDGINQKSKTEQWEIPRKKEIQQHIPNLKKEKFRKHFAVGESKHGIYPNCEIQIEKSLEGHLYHYKSYS